MGLNLWLCACESLGQQLALNDVATRVLK
ncbi:hypothetical protein AGR7A_Cc120197 [Agrobacterium deltaense NCPPB 1641]|uniref:Uncharacterized protein n=1 Tax=Agrobacterium deltaense NCPPB 1641 TaxID=1183425 RepID=A0A1S7TJ95_9HYPH|nr:hypothetical protein AGR7A_Cc120197 [Agrobacterium deltaense NCPPB 1641]